MSPLDSRDAQVVMVVLLALVFLLLFAGLGYDINFLEFFVALVMATVIYVAVRRLLIALGLLRRTHGETEL
jgi:multisubunit Na+/H+ antiporter MnhE subunit